MSTAAEAQSELEAIENKARDTLATGPAVHLGLLGKDGLGVGAMDLEVPDYQVALGFTAGPNEAEARKFARRVVSRLKKHWVVTTVPVGKGAFPLECRRNSEKPVEAAARAR